MSLPYLILTLIIVVVVLWVINVKYAMDRSTRTIVNGVILISLVFWLLHSYGVIGTISK
jgi:hypothetical protein